MMYTVHNSHPCMSSYMLPCMNRNSRFGTSTRKCLYNCCIHPRRYNGSHYAQSRQPSQWLESLPTKYHLLSAIHLLSLS